MLCGHCEYWDSSAHGGQPDVPGAPAGGFGRCRRHAPPMPAVGMRAHWPVTSINDWCGEFLDKGDDP